MDKEEGFVIDLGEISGEGGVLVDVPAKEETPPKKVDEGKEEKDTPPEDGLIIVDTPPEETEEEKAAKAEAEAEAAKDKPPEGEEDKSKSGKDAGELQETESPSFLHATTLRDKGVLPNLDLDKLKDMSDEEVLNATIWATQDEIEEGVKSIVEQTDAAYQEFVEMVNSGVNVDEYARIKASQKRFDGITDDLLEDNVELQKSIVAEDLKDRGLSSDDIEITIEELEEKDGALFKKAKPAMGRINKRDTERKAKIAKDAERKNDADKKDQEKVMGRIDSTLESTKEIIPGIPLSKKEKDVVKRLMTVPVGQEGGVPISKAQEMRGKDPVAWETKLAYYVAIGLFDDVPKWDRVLKRANSDAAARLMQSLKGTKAHKAGKPAPKKPEEDDGPMKMPFNT